MTDDDLPLVLVSRALPSAWIRGLEGHARVMVGPTEAVPNGSLAPELQRALRETAGLLTLLTEQVDEGLLAGAPKLKVVSNMAVGVDNIDLEACARRNIAVGHTPGVLTEATADLTLAILLAVARRIAESADDAANGRWGPWSPDAWLGLELRGRTLGVVGLGAIGSAVATRAAAFGMDIVYATRSSRPQTPPGWQRVSMDDLLARADIVTVHVPLTAQTHHLLNAAAFSAMKPGALVINTARGSVLDQDALLRSLDAGHLGGAALDVTDPEPLPPTHPLFARRNVVITPHIGSATERTRRAMAKLAVRNVLCGLEGRPLEHPVTSI